MELKIPMVGMSTCSSTNSKASQPVRQSVTPNEQIDCAGCHQTIKERYMLKAVDQLWHEDCLKCSCCDCRLGELGSTLFTKANLILCKRDYLRLFGNTGYCSACNKMIPAFEMVMRAKTNVYHLECFACQQCNHRFCVGDKFYLCNDKILCEYDYEERLVFASMSYNYNNIAHIKKHTQNVLPTNKHLQPPSTSQHQQLHHQHPSNGPLTSKNDTASTTNYSTPSSVNNMPAPAMHPPIAGHVLMPSNSQHGSGGAASLTSQSDDTSSGYGSPESPMFDRK